MVMIKDNHISVAGGITNAMTSVDEFLAKENLAVPVEVLWLWLHIPSKIIFPCDLPCMYSHSSSSPVCFRVICLLYLSSYLFCKDAICSLKNKMERNQGVSSYFYIL